MTLRSNAVRSPIVYIKVAIELRSRRK